MEKYLHRKVDEASEYIYLKIAPPKKPLAEDQATVSSHSVNDYNFTENHHKKLHIEKMEVNEKEERANHNNLYQNSQNLKATSATLFRKNCYNCFKRSNTQKPGSFY